MVIKTLWNKSQNYLHPDSSEACPYPKDMIVSGGEYVYPREVEEVLYNHPAELECAVFCIPDPEWVEANHAVVALRQGISAKSEARHLSKAGRAYRILQE